MRLFSRGGELGVTVAPPIQERNPRNGCEHQHLDKDVHDKGLEYVILR